MKIKCPIFLVLIFLYPTIGLSFKPSSFGIGVGYFSQNILSKTAQNQTGATGVLGEANYPINLKYDFPLFSDWFWAPQLSYTISPRSTMGSSAKVTLTHLSFLFGKNFGSDFDWYFGPGIFQQDIKGTGGTTVLNNGTGFATFAMPGSSSTSKKMTVNLGSSLMLGDSRLGLEFIIESAFSTSERTQSMMFSYSYLFGGSGNSGSRPRRR